MIDSRCVRYTHHKPPYEDLGKHHFGNTCQTKQTPCCNTQTCDTHKAVSSKPVENCGLLEYRKWWEMVDVDISVNGTLISGMPIFIKGDTLRVINQNSSFFIPIEKIDYIRTNDGLCTH